MILIYRPEDKEISSDSQEDLLMDREGACSQKTAVLKCS